MTCMEFRKFAGAFADGELDTVRNLDALDHLKMCPDCTRRVDGVHALKRVLASAGRQEQAPPALEARVRRALDLPVPARGPRTSLPPRPVPFRLWRGAALAAGILLALAVWRWWPQSQRTEDRITYVPGQQVAEVRAMHQACTAMALGHHDATLPRSALEAGAALGTRLHMSVLMPDLTAYGFEFVGAERCDMRGRPVAHGLYKAKATGDFLSVFTIERGADLRPSDFVRVGDRTYYVCDADRDHRLSVVAWSRGDQTYLWCARWCINSLIQIADCACESAETCPSRDASGAAP